MTLEEKQTFLTQLTTQQWTLFIEIKQKQGKLHYYIHQIESNDEE